jgi:hypothetical protein
MLAIFVIAADRRQCSVAGRRNDRAALGIAIAILES